MSALSSSACKLSIPGAFPFFRCPIAFLTLVLLGSDVSISSISSGSSVSISLTGLLGFSLFSTSEKCSSHRLVLLSLSLRILPFLSITAALCLGLSLLNTFVRVYSVFMCCCLAAFSASSAISSVQLLLSTLTCLLTSLSFCRYSSCHLFFCLSDLAPINFCFMAFLWSIRVQASWLNHGLFFFFLYPRTFSAVCT